MNKLFYIDKSIPLNSLPDLFKYAINKVKNYNPSSQIFLNDLFDYFAEVNHIKEQDPLVLSDELDNALAFVREKYPDDRNAKFVANYLMSRTAEVIHQLCKSILK